LTRLNWRRSGLEIAHRFFNDVKGRSEASLDLIERVKDNRDKVLREHEVHQNRSKTYLVVSMTSAEYWGVPSLMRHCPITNQSLGDKPKDGAFQAGNAPYRATARSASLSP
jgi:hypothetical protein